MEQLHDFPDDPHEFVERCNAWFASQRRIGWEHYLDGQAYLEWHLTLQTGRRWYELGFIAKKIDPARDGRLGLPDTLNIPTAKVARGGDPEQQPMLVYQVQAVKGDEGIVPSWIGLQVRAQPHGFRPGLPRLVLDPFIEVSRVVAEGKARIVCASTARHRDGADRVVESAHEAVDAIADDRGEPDWGRLFQGELEPGLPRLEILNNRYAVSVLAQVPKDCVVELGQVRLRALQLQ